MIHKFILVAEIEDAEGDNIGGVSKCSQETDKLEGYGESQS